MAIDLNKADGYSIDLSKAAPGLNNITVHLWWNDNISPIDLDISAFILNNTPNGPKLINDRNFVFYNNMKSPTNAVWKDKDERASGTEELFITLSNLLPEDDEVSLVITIDDKYKQGHTFGQISDAGIKIINSDTKEDIAFFDLDAQFTNETAVQVGSFFKQNGEYSFQAVGAGFQLGLGDFVGGYRS
jgi:tellurium resistance protein TerD